MTVSPELFRLSRSKIDLFLSCPRCFYLDRRLGIAQPPCFAFSLNSAVDVLLKKEFDAYRAKHQAHPWMKEAGIDAIVYDHPRMDEWRDALRGGVTYAYPGTNLLVTGAVDDIWQDPQKQLIVVEYKATAKAQEVSINAGWQQGYKRQVEIYQWLLRKNGFDVAETGYFLYCNGLTDRPAFDKRLEFEVTLIPYKGSDRWVDGVIKRLYQCLCSDDIPQAGKACVYCQYRHAAASI